MLAREVLVTNPMILGVLSLVVSLLALVGVYYNKRQTDLMKRQVDLLTEESDKKKTWAKKHAEACRLVLHTDKHLPLKTGGAGVKWGYECVFSENDLRSQIETFIVQKDFTGIKPRLKARNLPFEELLSPTIQGVIEQTIAAVEQFQTRHPEDAAMLDLQNLPAHFHRAEAR